MSAFYLPDENGKQRMCYLIGYIDDHSRRVTHAQFYFDATLSRLEDSLKKAVIKFGAPDSLFVDNGQIYISDDFKLICARLGIVVKYSKAYHPEGKGKIEKFWQYVQSSFLTEIRNNKVSSIVELNDLFFAWLKTEYHDKVHSSIGATPLERWNKSLEVATRLRYFSPVQIDQAFLHYAERTVNKYGVISFDGNEYAIDGSLVNKRIAIRYNPFHLDTVHVYYQDKYYGLARIVDLKKEKHKSVTGIEEDPAVDSKISQQYFENIKSNYQDYLKEQLNTLLDNEIQLEARLDNPTDKTDAMADKTRHIVPDEKTQALKRQEFVKIISKALGIKTLSYAEKGKLYELWQTFKEFNKELLIAIVDDIKTKTPDFNNNFLYYLAQIKNIYLEKSKEA
jgi:putative transposase